MGDGRSHVPPERRDLAMVFQDYALWPHLTVLGNVRYALRRRKLAASKERVRATEVLERVGLAAVVPAVCHLAIPPTITHLVVPIPSPSAARYPQNGCVKSDRDAPSHVRHLNVVMHPL